MTNPQGGDKPASVEARRFPIMGVESVGRFAPPFVPWEFMAPHEAQARSNHQQSLSRLAERGGLDVTEALAVIGGRRWRSMPLEEAGAQFRAALAAWEERHSELAKLRAEVETVRDVLTELDWDVEPTPAECIRRLVAEVETLRARVAAHTNAAAQAKQVAMWPLNNTRRILGDLIRELEKP